MDGPIVERMFAAFLTQMMETGAVDQDDIVAAADRLDAVGDGEAAHGLRHIVFEAISPSASERIAESARARFHSIEGGKDSV